MNGRMSRWMAGKMDECIDEWMYRWMNGRMKLKEYLISKMLVK